MKLLSRRSLSFFAVYSAACAIAQAHPGHEGHEGDSFTWDFSHLSAHPLATVGFLTLAAVAVWAGWNHLRSTRSESVRNSRESNRN